MGIAADKPPVLVHPHLVGVGERQYAPAVARGLLADIKGRADLQKRLLALRGVDRRGELGVAVHIQNAVVADAVAAAEIAVGVVVEHTPAEAARDILPRRDGVEHVGVAERVFEAVRLAVIRFRREHMAVVLGDQIRAVHVGRHVFFLVAALLHAVVDEVIEGVDVLQEAALFEVAHAAGRAGRVERVRRGVGALIERVVVLRLVDAHAPEDDRRMVAVLAHHVLGVAHDLLLPFFVAEVLPAGDLGEHQQAQLVAAVDEVLRLGIVRGTHGVAAQLVFQNLRVEPLHGARHGVAHIGVALVAVEAAQLHLFPVEIKSVRAPLCLAETEARLHAVEQRIAVPQLGHEGIEIRRVNVPALRVRNVKRELCRRAGDRRALFTCLHPLAQGKFLAHFAAERHRAVQHAACRGTHEHVVDVGLLRDLQPHLAVQPAVGHVVDDVTERRDVLALTGVDLDGELRFPADCQRAGQLHAERRVPAAVLAELHAVREHLRAVSRRADAEEHAPARPHLRRGDAFAIAADHLIDALVEVVVGRFAAGVGQRDGDGIAEILKMLRKFPIAVEIDVLSHGRLPILCSLVIVSQKAGERNRSPVHFIHFLSLSPSARRPRRGI